MTISSSSTPDSQSLLNQIVIEFMREQKRKRRWRWIVRSLFLILIILALYKGFFSLNEEITETNPHVGLIKVDGTISDTENASAENIIKGLKSAYKNTHLKALILRINSPGGSPVQANYIYNALKYYRKKYPEIKTYAVCVDLCASAAYYIAAGTDQIYANPSSLVGSIGVVYSGFGFVDTLEKLGITRRLRTAGINKGFLDPFMPINTSQDEFLQTMLNDVHHQFIDNVKEGRGNRLNIDDKIFSGLFWTGQQAKSYGLIDGFASSEELARDFIKVDPVVDYTYKQKLFEQVAKNMGTAIANQLPTALGLTTGIKA